MFDSPFILELIGSWKMNIIKNNDKEVMKVTTFQTCIRTPRESDFL